MKTNFSKLLVGALAGMAACAVATASDLEQALKQFAGYDYGQPKKVLHDTRMAAFRGADDRALRLANEQLLLAFVQSDAPLAARREACFWLSDLATDASRPVLAKLAGQEEFADVAQIALDALMEPRPAAAAPPSSPAGRFKAAVMASGKPVDLLAGALLGDDEARARLALNLIAGGVATREACAWLGANAGRLSAPRQVVAMNVLLQVDAAEKEAVITRLAGEGDGEARLAAIRNLGALGRGQDVARLMELLNGPDEAVAAAARLALLVMPEATVRDGLLSGLAGSDPAAQGKAIELADARGAAFAADELARIAGEAGNANRKAAAAALGRAAPPEAFARVLPAFAAAEGTPIEKEMQAAVWMLARRQPDYDQAVKLMEEQGAKCSGKARESLGSMAKKLAAMKPQVSLEAANDPQSAAAQPGPAPVNPDVLLPGSYREITPQRFKVAAYLDCGAAGKAQDGGITIECLNGKPWNSNPGTDPALSLHFAASSLDYVVSGLKEGGDYILGTTWWDSDFNGRRQALVINGEEVLPDTRPIAYEQGAGSGFRGKATPPRIQFALLPEWIRNGRVEIGIRKLEGPNAVTSELWVMERVKPRAGKQVLLVSGQDYPGHHWRKTGAVMAAIVGGDERMELTICETPYAVGLKHLDRYDVVFVHFKNYEADLPSTPATRKRLQEFVMNGGGMCMSHFACGAFEEWPDFVGLAGRVWNGEGHDKRGPFTVRIVDREHPVTRGLEDFETDDELYFCLKGDPGIHLLCDAHSKVKKADHPQAFVFQPGKGRVFLSTLGHDVKAFDAPSVRQLYRQGAAWAAGLER